MTNSSKGKILMELVIAAIPPTTVALGTIVFRRLFPLVDPDIIHLVASIVFIALLLILVLMIRKGVMKRLFDHFHLRFKNLSLPIISLIAVIIWIIWVKASPIAHQCIGRSPGSSEFFSVYPDYDPSGYMGDTGDIVGVKKNPNGASFKYEVRGRGPHEWEYKYINDTLNTNPAKFAGIMYLFPANNFGQEPGFDLRAFSSAIAWEARSLSGEVNVEFKIGGVRWIWDNMKKVKPPCPGSLWPKSLATHTLIDTAGWQSFEVDLSAMPQEAFINVIGGFAWIVSWGSNGIQADETGTAPERSRTFEFEIRNIRYMR